MKYSFLPLLRAINTPTMPLNYEIDIATNDLSKMICEKISIHPIYKKIVAHLDDKKMMLYFQMCIKKEIREYIVQVVLNGNSLINSANSPMRIQGIWIPTSGIRALLRECWPTNEIPIVNSIKKRISFILDFLKGSIRKFMLNLLQKLFDVWNRYWFCANFEEISIKKPIIAVHYREGLNLQRRTDIVWFPYSGIEEAQVLMYFDDLGVERKYKFIFSISPQILNDLKKLCLKYVLIPGLGTTKKRTYGWAPSKSHLPDWLINLKKQKTDDIGKWIINISQKIVRQVYFWKDFFETFNVKILFLPDEGDATHLLQGMAFDILGINAGITVGKQRSIHGWPPESKFGFYSKDLIFTWNNRFTEYLIPKYNEVNTQIVTGHPNDMNFYSSNLEMQDIKRHLIRNGARFIVALFDTGYGEATDINFVTSEIKRLYKYFLVWVIEDPSIGIVIKSKKPNILQKISDMLPLLSEAERTGRCARVRNERGRFPSEAAKIADFAVGANVSSALIEAVIAGCKGVHYHYEFPIWHEYYKWGYEKLVFTNLDRMMEALKGYKANPASNPSLGDWTPYLHLLDPFRDGLGGERMGTYLRWCLKGFGDGLARKDVIDQASKKYAAEWGDDKVIHISKW